MTCPKCKNRKERGMTKVMSVEQRKSDKELICKLINAVREME